MTKYYYRQKTIAQFFRFRGHDPATTEWGEGKKGKGGSLTTSCSFESAFPFWRRDLLEKRGGKKIHHSSNLFILVISYFPCLITNRLTKEKRRENGKKKKESLRHFCLVARSPVPPISEIRIKTRLVTQTGLQVGRGEGENATRGR